MAYTPELSVESCQILRRIAWLLGKPMTQSIEIVIKNIAMFIDRKKVCSKCRDNSICKDCIFNKQNHKISNKEILCLLSSYLKF
jgi:hypothetical protein